ncbi:ArsC/Spx/MgsR family protein [Rapidithrix thailandica]|uniref:ArsC/Spx/MgsR family protein n=1 Tax=Rapidithrix thailandica TaxID=413964 RepID=A0AAW9SBN7_9BACT
MKKHPYKIKVYYNNNSDLGKKTIAYAKSISNYVTGINYCSDSFTTTIWRDLLNRMQLTPKELLDKANPKYQATLRGHEFDDEGWLNIMMKNPDLIKAPIVVYGDQVKLCLKPSDILKM